MMGFISPKALPLGMLWVLCGALCLGMFNPATCAQTLDAGSDALQRAPIRVGEHTLNVEVARTTAQQARGLMGRDRLAPDAGMLFVFDAPRRTTFWMKDCRIPLDILFYRNARIAQIVENAAPCAQEPCPLYRSAAPVDGALELMGGAARQLKLRVGDALIASPPRAARRPHRQRSSAP